MLLEYFFSFNIQIYLKKLIRAKQKKCSASNEVSYKGTDIFTGVYLQFRGIFEMY